jgi:hypothetical protein
MSMQMSTQPEHYLIRTQQDAHELSTSDNAAQIKGPD